MTDTIDQTLEETLATESVDIDGVVSVLGRLGRGAVIHEKGMCLLFSRSASAVRSAVKRGELPETRRLFGQCTWTAGVLIDSRQTRDVRAHRGDPQGLTAHFPIHLPGREGSAG